MKGLSEYIIHILNKTHICEEWIKTNYKLKPIIILGDTGCGKSSLADYLMRDHTCININSDHSRTIPHLDTYLNDSFFKKSITMLFDQKNPYKSIIFDDIDYIRTNDKQLFNSIIQFSKQPHKNHPVIYIISSLQNKDILSLYNRCFPIHITLSPKQLIHIVRNYFVKDKRHMSYVKTIISQCHSNFHSIQSNLSFHDKKETIQTYEKKETNKIIFLDRLLQMESVVEMIRMSSSEHTIISLNILENYSPLILQSTLSDKDKLQLLDKIYYYHCLSDNFGQICNPYYDWGLTEVKILLGIIYPIILLRKLKPRLITFKYTKNISQCIIHTYHLKLMNNKKLDFMDIFILFHMFQMNYPNQFIQTYIQELSISKKILTKFFKYYETLYNHKIPKQKITQALQ